MKSRIGGKISFDLEAKWGCNRGVIKFSLRLNEELHKRLKELAEKEHPSIHARQFAESIFIISYIKYDELLK